MTKQKLKLNILEQEIAHSQILKNSCQRISAGKLFTTFLTLLLHRFAVFELEYPTPDGRTESKILFILYAPDIVDSREKFIYATSKEDVRKKVQPFNKEFQVNDWADLDDESFQKVLKH